MSSPDIFISYSREDRPTARLFADRLGEEGFSVWWDAALHSGETFDEVIERNLRAAKAVVVLWSPRSVASRWVRAEATLADRRGSLAPAIIEACDRPIIFELTHTAELSHWSGDRSDFAWAQFVADLRQLVGTSAVAQSRLAAQRPAAAEPPRSPTESRFGGHVGAGMQSTAFPGMRAAPQQVNNEQTQLFNYDEELNPSERHFLDVMTQEDDAASFEVGPLGLRIGRSFPADVVLDNRGVSRNHCEVALSDGDLLVTDLDSTNGTFVDDERIFGTVELPVGSVLRVGGVRLVHEVRTPVAAR